MTVARPGVRNVVAAVAGNALEFYDFVTYTFFAVQIGRVFFPAQSAYASLMLSLATFGAGFAMRPVGGMVIGRMADRIGRRPAMMFALVLMGVGILVVALVPSYAAIGLAAPVLVVLARMVQGFALGGQVGSATAFLMEAAPPSQRGLYTAWQVASQNCAVLAGGIVGFVLAGIMTAPELGLWLAYRVRPRRRRLTVRHLDIAQRSRDSAFDREQCTICR